MPVASTNLDYLTDSLRLQLGDTDSTAYRYLDTWLYTALVLSVKTLQRWWNYKYLIDSTTNDVSRNTQNQTFIFPEPPIVEAGDERPIILMASIIIKQGSLENHSWNVGSWKDTEIYYSNTEGSRYKMESIKKDWEELINTIKLPQKRLAKALKNSLPGYLKNNWETGE